MKDIARMSNTPWTDLAMDRRSEEATLTWGDSLPVIRSVRDWRAVTKVTGSNCMSVDAV